MTIRVERTSEAGTVTLGISGRVVAEHIEAIRSELPNSGPSVVIDLEYATGGDLDGIRFLRDCERRGVRLIHCSQYLRDWISREDQNMSVEDDQGNESSDLIS